MNVSFLPGKEYIVHRQNKQPNDENRETATVKTVDTTLGGDCSPC
jgi:hypothetical protein